MYRNHFVFFALLVLLGCNMETREETLETALVTEVAWNERVQLTVPQNKTADSVRFVITLPNSTTRTVIEPDPLQSGTRVAFDLPDPDFPFSPDTSETPPDADFPANPDEYTYRAIQVRATVRDSSNNPLASEDYKPYGAVVSGQINILLRQATCPAKNSTFQSLKVIHSLKTTNNPNLPEAEALCFLTLDIGVRGMRQAINTLRNNVSNEAAINRNVVFNSDSRHQNAKSTDPTCDQTITWLDPTAADPTKNYFTLNEASIRSSVNANLAHTNGFKGAGIRVFVVGSGVNASLGINENLSYNFEKPGTPPNDDFICDPVADGVDIEGHDQHVAQIIKTIAPDVDLVALKICDHHGSCPSAFATMSLMYIRNKFNNNPTIVNMSAGGELPDATTFYLLQSGGVTDLSRFLFVASAGNTKVAVRHYPGSYSPLSVPLGSLPNVMSVGAVGRTSTGWSRAEFTTAQNFDILAPGVNLCPPTVSFRCLSSANYPDDLGLSGTSFAAPHVAGVAALYADANPGVNIGTLLINNRQNGRVWYQ